MSYFTETFESILEFKSDIAAGYADRRTYEKSTHMHQPYLKDARKELRSSYTNRHSGGSGFSGNDKPKHEKTGAERLSDVGLKSTKANYAGYNISRTRDAFGTEDYYNNNRAKAKSDPKIAEIRKQSGIETKAGSKGSGKNESYDPVYEDLCRMGIID